MRPFSGELQICRRRVKADHVEGVGGFTAELERDRLLHPKLVANFHGPIMVHESSPLLKRFWSHPRRVFSVCYELHSPFHGGNTGSNPVGNANNLKDIALDNRRGCFWRFLPTWRLALLFASFRFGEVARLKSSCWIPAFIFSSGWSNLEDSEKRLVFLVSYSLTWGTN